jgi:hypothetical protein
MVYKCVKCATLWEDYAKATHAHVLLESKLEVAQLRHDEAAVQQLLAETMAAAEVRGRLRRELNEHEQAEHPESKSQSAGLL